MHARPLLLAFLVSALAACASDGPQRVTDADAPRALPTDGPVMVDWSDPASFAELRHSGNRWESERCDWVRQLAQYVQASIARVLPAGERAEVTILDIERAGSYHYWSSQHDDVRVMRDIDAPRMRLHLRRVAADGRVLDDREHALIDFAYLMGPQPLGTNDPLRYEKRMIDRWVRKEFNPRGTAAQASR